MSLNDIQVHDHCKNIMKNERFRDKILILCEGQILESDGRLSPSAYKQMNQDSKFYDACIPSWFQPRPKFVNCGDRKDVLNIFFQLRNLHQQEVNNQSCVNPNKLFALIDLDIQIANFQEDYEIYDFKNTEEIFYHLYDKCDVNETNAIEHRIWVTGLMHKEAYFLKPEIQAVFNDFYGAPVYNGSPVNLETVYLDMINEILGDSDLCKNWPRVFQRVSYCLGLEGSEINKFQTSWNQLYQQCQDDIQKDELQNVLLRIVKSKTYWKRVQPSLAINNNSEKGFRDMLINKIGEFYSKQECNVKNHIPFFFNTLYQSVYGTA